MSVNYYLSMWLLFQLFVIVPSKQVQLTQYAFWDQNGTTVVGWANGTKGSSPSHLNEPFDLSITTNDVLYVSDHLNHRIIVLSLNANNNKFIIHPISDSNSSLFNQPVGLSITNTSLYVLERYSHRIHRLSLNGTNPTTIPGLTELKSGFYLHVDDDTNIYLSETSAHRVLLFSPNSANGTIVAGTGMNGSNDDQLNGPYGLFVTHNRTIYIADFRNHRIMKWFLGARSGICVAGNGTAGSSSAQLSHPTQVVVDTNEYMYITEDGNHRVVRWTPNSSFGVCIAACTGTKGTASTQLNRPHSLAFDSNGSLYVSDNHNHRVQKYQIFNYHTISYRQPEVSTCSTWNFNATTFLNIGTVDRILFGVFVGINGTEDQTSRNRTQIVVQNENTTNSPEVSTDLVREFNLYITIQGNIYVDNGAFQHRLYQWSSNPTFNRTLMPILPTCASLFLDINGSIYCSMPQKHQVIQIFADHTSNAETFTFGNGTNESTPDTLSSPSGIFVDIDLRLYVADTDNHRIQRFEKGCNDGTTVAGNVALGNKGLRFPTGVVLDRHGDLFIADRGNHRIIRSGTNGFRCIVGCDKGNGSQADQLHHPRALWFDTSGNMFVLDQGNHRIQKFFLQANSSAEASSSCSIPLTCWDPKHFGLSCNHSAEICDRLQPCRNNGTCINLDDNQNYNCSCAPGFNGTRCHLDHRPCTPTTCWNNGRCNATSDTTFNCTCAPGWTGGHCERMIDYCFNVTCENQGVCWASPGKFACECVSGYSGEFCQIVATRIVIYQIVSKSFAYVAILAMGIVATFVVVMDILKYCFGIDPVEEERERMRREKRAKKRQPVVERFVYVNAPGLAWRSKPAMPISEGTNV